MPEPENPLFKEHWSFDREQVGRCLLTYLPTYLQNAATASAYQKSSSFSLKWENTFLLFCECHESSKNEAKMLKLSAGQIIPKLGRLDILFLRLTVR